MVKVRRMRRRVVQNKSSNLCSLTSQWALMSKPFRECISTFDGLDSILHSDHYHGEDDEEEDENGEGDEGKI